MAAPTLTPDGFYRPHFQMIPAPDQLLRARNRKLHNIISYLHRCYEAAKLLGCAELAVGYRESYAIVANHSLSLIRGEAVHCE